MTTSQDKSPLLHGRRSSSHGRIRNGMHFADFKPKGLSWLWTHAVVNVRHFLKDYSLPTWLTLAFVLLIVVASLIRASQRSSLAALLATVTTVTQDYDSLTSGDAFEAPKRGDTSEDPGSAQAPTGTATSTTLNPGNPTAPQNPGTGNGGGGTSEPAPKFAAAIAAFQQDSTELDCSSPNPNKPNCSKRYNFSARISTQNGPGSVSYGWRSNISGASEDGTYGASSGSSSQTLQKSVSIPCLSPGDYTMQFVILSPTQVQSTTLSINHNCIGI